MLAIPMQLPPPVQLLKQIAIALLLLLVMAIPTPRAAPRLLASLRRPHPLLLAAQSKPTTELLAMPLTVLVVVVALLRIEALHRPRLREKRQPRTDYSSRSLPTTTQALLNTPLKEVLSLLETGLCRRNP
jgi:hypothetical protein